MNEQAHGFYALKLHALYDEIDRLREQIAALEAKIKSYLMNGTGTVLMRERDEARAEAQKYRQVLQAEIEWLKHAPADHASLQGRAILLERELV
jgi:hypothetical protein